MVVHQRPRGFYRTHEETIWQSLNPFLYLEGHPGLSVKPSLDDFGVAFDSGCPLWPSLKQKEFGWWLLLLLFELLIETSRLVFSLGMTLPRGRAV